MIPLGGHQFVNKLMHKSPSVNRGTFSESKVSFIYITSWELLLPSKIQHVSCHIELEGQREMEQCKGPGKEDRKGQGRTTTSSKGQSLEPERKSWFLGEKKKSDSKHEEAQAQQKPVDKTNGRHRM